MSGVSRREGIQLSALLALSKPGAKSRPLVGVNYFAGWWRPEPNKWQCNGQDWRPAYPERLPLLGAFNEQETMDREIRAAADHGVDFFAILWYKANPGMNTGPHSELLNEGVLTFMRSRHAPRMKFIIEYCNHAPFGVTEEAQWGRCVRTWIETMRHPSYLRVGGRPVFKIHAATHFFRQCAEDASRCHARLDGLRRAVRQAGQGELLLGAGVGSGESIGPDHPAKHLYDFTACYMAVPPIARRPADYPYSILRQFTAENRLKHTDDAIPHLPYIAAGWNPRPWRDPRPSFTLPSREDWTDALLELKQHLATGKLGFPVPEGIRPAFTIYAWNEFGEGGMVAPTRGDGYMKLEVIRNVFGIGALI
jgi:hypothetical protein